MSEAISNFRPDGRMERRGIHLNLHEGWIAGVLLAIMLVSVTASVASANWVDGLWQAVWASVAGMLFAALVSRLRINGFLALLLALIVGTALVAWILSSHVNAPPDATWNEKMLLLEDRLDVWLVRVISGGIGTDNVVFLGFMCALGWLLGYISGWSVFRHHQPWGAILPAGAALLLNLFYAPPQSGLYLMLFLLAALLLLVRTTLLKRQQAWAAYAVRFASDIGLDFLMYGVIFSGLIILIAWLIPPTAPGPAWLAPVMDRVRAPLQDFQDDMSRAFSAVRGTNNAAPTTYFSTSLAMGGPIRLGDREVFQVDSPYGTYWRAVSFDQYTGTGWVSTADETADFVAADPRLKIMPTELRRVITESVEVRLPTDNLVISASQPVKVNEGVNTKFFVGRTGDNQAYVDVQSMRLQQAVTLGEQYTVLSSVSAADEGALRTASTQIPSYIHNQYMDLPPTVTQRVRDLTMKVTAGATTNYDKAKAIESYLRTHIKYNADVDPVPQGWDGVDYVLFERPEGYCNYYASAMAVMARIAGIPSRVSSGYAVGSPSDDGLYHISEANAHSWPELYFGDLGWIEFEPTAAQPEINRPAPQSPNDPRNKLLELNQDDQDAGTRNLSELRAEEERNQQNAAARLAIPALSGSAGLLTGAFLLLGLLVAGTLTFVQIRWQRQLKQLKPGAQASAEMYRFANYAGLQEHSGATADETAQHLASLLPDQSARINDVNTTYVQERYGAAELSPEQAADNRATGVAIQKSMWRAIYLHYLGNRIASWRAQLKFQRKPRNK